MTGLHTHLRRLVHIRTMPSQHIDTLHAAPVSCAERRCHASLLTITTTHTQPPVSLRSPPTMNQLRPHHVLAHIGAVPHKGINARGVAVHSCNVCRCLAILLATTSPGSQCKCAHARHCVWVTHSPPPCSHRPHTAPAHRCTPRDRPQLHRVPASSPSAHHPTLCQRHKRWTHWAPTSSALFTSAPWRARTSTQFAWPSRAAM